MDLSKIPESVMKFILFGSRPSGKRASGDFALVPVEVDAGGNLRVAVASIAGVAAIPIAVTMSTSVTAAVTGTIESAKGCDRQGGAVAATTPGTTVFTATARLRDAFLKIAPLLAENVVVSVWHRPLGAARADSHFVGLVSILSGAGPMDVDLGGLANTDKIDVQVETGTTAKVACTTYGELY